MLWEIHPPTDLDIHQGRQTYIVVYSNKTDQRPYILGNIPPNRPETSHLGIYTNKELRDFSPWDTHAQRGQTPTS